MARPRLHQWLAAAQPVGQVSDRERVGLCRIVFHDHAEILQHQKARPLRACGNQKEGAVVGARESLASGAMDSGALPLAHGHLPAAVGQQEIKALRHHHLVAPALRADPAVLLEIVGGRGDEVWHRIDHVASAVAVEVDGKTLERGRHELGRPEGARPGTLELFSFDVAARQDFERRKKFLAEIVLPAADTGQRRGRADHRPLADLGAVIGFDAPDRGDHVTVDAVGVLNRIEGGAVPGEHRAPVGDARVTDQDVEIVPDRLGEFRLRIHQVHDPQIGREPRSLCLEGGARHLAARDLRPQPFEAVAEIGRRGADRVSRHQRMAGGTRFAAPCRRRARRRRRCGRRRSGIARSAEQRAQLIKALAGGRCGERRADRADHDQVLQRCARFCHFVWSSGQPHQFSHSPSHGEYIWLQNR